MNTIDLSGSAGFDNTLKTGAADDKRQDAFGAVTAMGDSKNETESDILRRMIVYSEAEIERLQIENAGIQVIKDRVIASHIADIERLQVEVRAGRDTAFERADEIERLQADKAAISQTASDYLHEIERLGALLNEYENAGAVRAEVDRLLIENRALRTETDEESPGTPLGRLAALARYAQKIGLCSGVEAKPAELFLIDEIERLRADMDTMRRCELAARGREA